MKMSTDNKLRAIKYDLFRVSPFSKLGPLGFLTATIESLST